MSQPKTLKFTREAKRFAESYGFQDVEIGRLRHHPVIYATVNGRKVSVVLPRKEEDQRMKENVLARMRRIARGQE